MRHWFVRQGKKCVVQLLWCGQIFLLEWGTRSGTFTGADRLPSQTRTKYKCNNYIKHTYKWDDGRLKARLARCVRKFVEPLALRLKLSLLEDVDFIKSRTRNKCCKDWQIRVAMCTRRSVSGEWMWGREYDRIWTLVRSQHSNQSARTISLKVQLYTACTVEAERGTCESKRILCVEVYRHWSVWHIHTWLDERSLRLVEKKILTNIDGSCMLCAHTLTNHDVWLHQHAYKTTDAPQEVQNHAYQFSRTFN